MEAIQSSTHSQYESDPAGPLIGARQGLAGLMLGAIAVSEPSVFQNLFLEKLRNDDWVNFHLVTEAEDSARRSMIPILLYHLDRDQLLGITLSDYSDDKNAAIFMFLHQATLLMPHKSLRLQFIEHFIEASWFTLLPLHIGKRALRSPRKYRSIVAFMDVYMACGRLPVGMKRRYTNLLFETSIQKLAMLDHLGCMNQTCSTMKHLRDLWEILETTDEHSLSKETELGIRVLTTYLKLCSRCFKVAYCSRKCQKAAWEAHRPECLRAPKLLSRAEQALLTKILNE